MELSSIRRIYQIFFLALFLVLILANTSGLNGLGIQSDTPVRLFLELSPLNALSTLLGQNPSPTLRTNLIVQSWASSRSEQNKNDRWAVREGNWKLVMGQGAGYSTEQGDRNPYLRFSSVGMVNSDFTPDGKLKPGAPPMQLYDLAADPGETRNLYRDHPEMVARLQKLSDNLVKNGRSRP